jgi:ribosomal protein L11 methyltransferase
MSELYRLRIAPSFSIEQAWENLEASNCEVLYSSEEEGSQEIFAYLPSPEAMLLFDWIESCTPYSLPPINWESQWAAHSKNYQDGFVQIDFSTYGRTAPLLKLKAGSGFGDLSHPTTRLMLKLLAQHLRNQIVIDIGCGSGILTLAAAAMGASKAFGIDIDNEALEHSRENASLNGLSNHCIFSSPSAFTWEPVSQPLLILMNMIQTEQQIAWNSLPALHFQKGEWITSGIRTEERDSYLLQTSQWGWDLLEEEEEEGWLAFYFSF